MADSFFFRVTCGKFEHVSYCAHVTPSQCPICGDSSLLLEMITEEVYTAIWTAALAEIEEKSCGQT